MIINIPKGTIIPELPRKYYSGTSMGNAIGPVKYEKWEDMWNMTTEDRPMIDRHLAHDQHNTTNRPTHAPARCHPLPPTANQPASDPPTGL